MTNTIARFAKESLFNSKNFDGDNLQFTLEFYKYNTIHNMKFFKKLFKCFKKTQKQDDNWDNVCEKVESWSTKSTDDKEESFETTLPTVEFDNQFS
ncbi:21192_t:CDS:1, partial [Dentiscutata erythropus]